MTKKVKRISSLKNQNQEIMLVEHDKDLHFFTMDDIEETLNHYFILLNKIKNEQDLREQYTHVQDAWNEYQTALCLVADSSDDII